MFKGVAALIGRWGRLKHMLLDEKFIPIFLLMAMNIMLAVIAFLKDVLLARYFGTSYYADSLYLAFFLPDTIGNGLLAAALGVSCVPIFAAFAKGDDQQRYEQVMNIILLLSILLAISFLVVLLPCAKWIFAHLQSNGTSDEQIFIYHYFLIMVPTVLLAPVATIAMVVLQVSGQFSKPAAMPVVLNMVLLLAVLFSLLTDAPLLEGGYLYSSAILMGTALVSCLTWLFVIKQQRLSFRPLIRPIVLFQENKREVSLFLKLFVPYFSILLCQQFVFLAERLIASRLEIGSISGLTYAFRLSQFPIWVFIAAINTVLLPSISKLRNEGKDQRFKKELMQSFQLVAGIGLSISILFFLLGDSLIELLFLKGAFDQASLKITSEIFSGYALSILGQSVYLYGLRYFVAVGKMRIPFFTSLIGSLLHILLVYIMTMWTGAAGIGIAAGIGYTMLGGSLLFFLYKDIFAGKRKVGNPAHE